MKGLAAGLTLVAAIALPGTAVASGPGGPGQAQQGAQVNPGSPAGQEYVIPIPAARSEAAGGSTGSTGGSSGGVGGAGGSAVGGGGSATGSGSPPLFGIGVTPASGNQRSSNARAGRRHRASKHGSTVSPAMAQANRPVSLASIPRPGSAGGDGWLALVGGGLLVLVVGGGAGIAVRRRLTGS